MSSELVKMVRAVSVLVAKLHRLLWRHTSDEATPPLPPPPPHPPSSSPPSASLTQTQTQIQTKTKAQIQTQTQTQTAQPKVSTWNRLSKCTTGQLDNS